ncbi:MAG: hypothetical protein ACRDK4_10110 [Solirubrobacteraceae bacterium]
MAAERSSRLERGLATTAPGGPDWDEGVLQALYEAAFSQPGAEIIGVLVGAPSRTQMPARIAAMIPASTARFPEHAQLNHEAWAYIHSTMARYYSGLDIVGWWVSRPGPDTSLDSAELMAASELFARPNQFGFVFDSRHRQAALYGWHDGRYVCVHEGPVPRRLTRPPTRSSDPLRGALRTFGIGLAAGLLGWLATGRPGL